MNELRAFLSHSFAGLTHVRDFASVEQLLVLANMQGLNAEFIHMGLPQGERLKRLNQIAIRQMQVLTSMNLKVLPGTKGK